jgi:hypothetical protein
MSEELYTTEITATVPQSTEYALRVIEEWGCMDRSEAVRRAIELYRLYVTENRTYKVELYFKYPGIKGVDEAYPGEKFRMFAPRMEKVYFQ